MKRPILRTGDENKGFNIPEGTILLFGYAWRGKIGSRNGPGLLNPKGIYVVGFSYPVVAYGKARIRVQVSAGAYS